METDRAAFEQQERAKRHRIEQRLLKTLWRSEGHRRLAESNIIGVLFADVSGGISSANDAFCQMLGYASDDVTEGRLRWDAVTAPESREADTRALAELRERSITEPYEKEFIARDGHRVPVLIGAALLEGSEHQMIAFVLDLTERKAAEERARRLTDELTRRNAQLEEDLRLAREIQLALLPQHYPRFPRTAAPEASLLRFAHRYVPAGPVGGDVFDVLPLSDQEALVLICDVMGHGVRAALVTAMIRTLVEQLRKSFTSPGELLAALNRGLMGTLRRTGSPMFVTGLCLTLHSGTREVRFASAGHPAALHLRRDARQVEPLKGPLGTGPALGLLEELSYPTDTATLAAGDGLLLFTDGLYEIEEQVEGTMTLERLAELALARVGDPLPVLLDQLLTAVQAEGRFLDDVCLVGLELS